MDAALLGSVAMWGAIATSAAAALGRSWSGRTLRISAALASVAVVVLAAALIGGDFSLAYVAETTSRATPWPYRLSATWGGMDGSMLFYAALTVTIGATAVKRLGSVGTTVVAGVSLGFLLLAAMIANPFRTLDIPAVDGGGLLAILQHPAMVYHPPILYLGLTSLVVSFALTIDAVVRGNVNRDWIRQTRRWLFLSWTFLTIGMAAGANWAYVELGWGGFWAWDPVENTALMPWLATTVFLHTSRIQERDGRLARWNVGFAVAPFVLTILGVYLTRSGVTGSIHSFAESPFVGRILLTAFAVIGALAMVLALRTLRGRPWSTLALTRRDTWLAANGGLLSAALLFVVVGSAYPAYAQVFLDETVAVAPRFFVTTIYPIAVLLVIGAAFALRTKWAAPMTSWRLTVFLGTAAATALLTALVANAPRPAPILLLGLAAATAVSLIWDLVESRPPRRRAVAYLAHLGLALVLLGVAGSALGDDFIGVMAPGDSAEVGGHVLVLDQVTTGESDRFIYVAAQFTVDGSDQLSPQIRAYDGQALPIAEPALRSTVTSDLIVAISRVTQDASTVNVSVFVRPLVWWVWLGATTMALAGLFALFWRDGDVSRRRRLATAEQQPEGTTTGSPAR